MTPKYHLRENYERQAEMLCKLCGVSLADNISMCTNLEVMCIINHCLKLQNCLTMTAEEMSVELH